MSRWGFVFILLVVPFYVGAQTKDTTKVKSQVEDSIWSLDIKGAIIKRDRQKLIQMGEHRPWDKPWYVFGKVVDTSGNPIPDVEVIFWITEKDYKPFDGATVTDENGIYKVRSDHDRDNRVFYKKGYRVAGERRPKTRVYVFYNYSVPNSIVMVPEDYSGDESKYEIGIKRTDLPPWNEYYEFEDVSLFSEFLRLNLLNVSDSSIVIKHNFDFDIYNGKSKTIKRVERKQLRKLKKEKRSKKFKKNE